MLSQTEHGSIYRHLGNETWLQSQDFTQDWANFRFWKRCIVVSLVLKSVHNTTVTCKLNFPSLVMHHFNDLLVHQRKAVGRLAQLSATRTPVCVPESRLSLTCALICDWTPMDCQSVVVANACAARLSISFVVMTRRSLKLIQHQHLLYVWGTVWVWLGSMFRLAWRQRAQRAHEEHDL